MLVRLAIQSLLSIVSTAKRDAVRFLKKVLQKGHLVPVDCSFSSDGARSRSKALPCDSKGGLTSTQGEAPLRRMVRLAGLAESCLVYNIGADGTGFVP
jgi:hypothetical protein